MNRRLVVALSSALALVPSTFAPASEAITSASSAVKTKDPAAYDREIELLVAAVSNSRKKIVEVGSSTILRDAGVKVPTDSDVQGFSVAGTADAERKLESRFGRLSTEQQNAVLELKAALAAYATADAALRKAVKAAPTLKSLTLAPGFQINTGNSSATYVPSVDFIGGFPMLPPNPRTNFDFQFLLSIKPEPPKGQSTDVAQSIRINTGVITANMGLNFSHFWKPQTSESDPSKDDSPQGVEARFGIPVAYQRADAAASGTTNPPAQGSTTSDFGLVSPELKVSVWLKYVLVGYKYAYHFAFGNSNEVYDQLQRTSAHKAYLATRIDALSGSPSSPFFVELSYTGGKNTIRNGNFSLALSKSLQWSSQ